MDKAPDDMYYCWKAQRCLASIKCLEISMFIIRNGGNGHQASCMWHLTIKGNESENLMYNFPLIGAHSDCYVFSYGVYVLAHFNNIPTIIFPTPFLHMITEKKWFQIYFVSSAEQIFGRIVIHHPIPSQIHPWIFCLINCI